MNVVIIEDELQARQLVKMLLAKYFNSLRLVGEALSIHGGIDLINAVRPDIVLLDIQLADGNSFEILNNVSYKNFKIIFITSYSDYAIKAFKFGAIHYLLKPFSENDFTEAINRIIIDSNENPTFLNQAQEVLNTIHNQKQLTTISIPTIKGFEIFDLKDMIYFEAIPGQISLECISKKRYELIKPFLSTKIY